MSWLALVLALFLCSCEATERLTVGEDATLTVNARVTLDRVGSEALGLQAEDFNESLSTAEVESFIEDIGAFESFEFEPGIDGAFINDEDELGLAVSGPATPNHGWLPETESESGFLLFHDVELTSNRLTASLRVPDTMLGLTEDIDLFAEVQVPGEIASSDSDTTRGRVARWRVPDEGTREIEITWGEASDRRPLWVGITAGIGLLALVGLRLRRHGR